MKHRYYPKIITINILILTAVISIQKNMKFNIQNDKLNPKILPFPSTPKKP